MGLRIKYPELANHLDSFKVKIETWKEPIGRIFRCQHCHEHAQAGRRPGVTYEWHITWADLKTDPSAPEKCQMVLESHQEWHRQQRIKFVKQRLNDGLYPEPNDDEMNPCPKPKL